MTFQRRKEQWLETLKVKIKILILKEVQLEYMVHRWMALEEPLHISNAQVETIHQKIRIG